MRINRLKWVVSHAFIQPCTPRGRRMRIYHLWVDGWNYDEALLRVYSRDIDRGYELSRNEDKRLKIIVQRSFPNWTPQNGWRVS